MYKMPSNATLPSEIEVILKIDRLGSLYVTPVKFTHLFAIHRDILHHGGADVELDDNAYIQGDIGDTLDALGVDDYDRDQLDRGWDVAIYADSWTVRHLFGYCSD